MNLPRRVAAAAFAAAERGWLPEPLLRTGARRLVRGRLRALDREPPLDPRSLASGPIAPAPREANEQHYEVPAEFFGLVLGKWRKYSCALWGPGTLSLDEAEEAMLAATVARAGLSDGQEVLDLGCGWGALTLYAASRYPGSRFLAVSNSRSQRAFIEREAERRGLSGVEVRTADVNDFDPGSGRFDRIVSIEMFEHLSNYRALMDRLYSWLRPGGRLFAHVFCHRERAYRFESSSSGDWMAREFFTGGLMPSADLLPAFRGRLQLEDRWLVEGTHYARTAEAWLDRLKAARPAVVELFDSEYGPGRGARAYGAWRLFFIGVAETFAYRGGREWGVAHYRFARPAEVGKPVGASRGHRAPEPGALALTPADPDPPDRR